MNRPGWSGHRRVTLHLEVALDDDRGHGRGTERQFNGGARPARAEADAAHQDRLVDVGVRVVVGVGRRRHLLARVVVAQLARSSGPARMRVRCRDEVGGGVGASGIAGSGMPAGARPARRTCSRRRRRAAGRRSGSASPATAPAACRARCRHRQSPGPRWSRSPPLPATRVDIATLVSAEAEHRHHRQRQQGEDHRGAALAARSHGTEWCSLDPPDADGAGTLVTAGAPVRRWSRW